MQNPRSAPAIDSDVAISIYDEYRRGESQDVVAIAHEVSVSTVSRIWKLTWRDGTEENAKLRRHVSSLR